jgi:hypothetical protein
MEVFDQHSVASLRGEVVVNGVVKVGKLRGAKMVVSEPFRRSSISRLAADVILTLIWVG